MTPEGPGSRFARAPRARDDAERRHLEAHGAAHAFVAERELAVSIARYALRHLGVEHDMEDVVARALRGHDETRSFPDRERLRSRAVTGAEATHRSR